VHKPLIAIIGRPNVGKSTFFNKISGQRIAIVEDIPGVTRDRIYADVDWRGKVFTFVDTGGIDPFSKDVFFSQMRYQAEIAIRDADIICFFTDARQGVAADDYEVANMLRKSKKPVLLVVNKVDHQGVEENLSDFYALGIGVPIPISSTNMLGLGDLLDTIVSALPIYDGIPDESDRTHIKLAVVGRPNVGKSTLVNRLLGEERALVSDIPGTTRDAIDTQYIDHDGIAFTIIDTAGIRRKKSIPEQSLERYSVLRSIAAIRRCDIAVMLVDAIDGVTEQDTKIAGLIHDENRAVIIAVNKWDVPEKQTGSYETYQRKTLESLKFLSYAPVLLLSAKTGQRINKILPTTLEVYTEYTKRVKTGTLNDIIADALASQQPPSSNGKRLKIYYALQDSTMPPTFVLFINDEALLHFSYIRYLENNIRKSFGFKGCPIRFVIREKKQEA